MKILKKSPQQPFLSPIQVVPTDTFKDAEICVFDIETTSLHRDCDITQISASTIDGRSKFDKYILPTKNITPSASKVTGLSVRDKTLFLHGKPVTSVDVEEGLSSFRNWLSSFGKSIILVGHNIKAFDLKHLFRHSNVYGVEFPFLSGFVDTLTVFKSLYPGQPSYSQEKLFRAMIGTDYDAHNSLSDVIALTALLNTTISDISGLCPYSFSYEWFKSFVLFIQKRDINLLSLNPLLTSKSISKGMAEKTASSGLCYRHLQIAFRREGELGIKAILGEQFSGTVRVTKNARIISSLLEYFKTVECPSNPTS